MTRTRALNIAFVIHLLLETFAAGMMFYMAVSGNVSMAKGSMIPAEFLQGIDLAHPTYRLFFSIFGFLLVGTLFPAAFALRSAPGTTIRKVAVLVCISYHAGVSLGGMILLPKVAFSSTGMPWMANPHLYIGLFFIAMFFLMPREASGPSVAQPTSQPLKGSA